MSIACQRILYLWPKLNSNYFYPSLNINRTLKKKVNYIKKAEAYYDLQYGKLFGDTWNRLKRTLQVETCPGIVINQFGDTENVIEEFEGKGVASLRDRYIYEWNAYLEENPEIENVKRTNKEICIEEDHINPSYEVHTFTDESRLIAAEDGLEATAILEGHIPSSQMKQYTERYEETDAFNESNELIVKKKIKFYPIKKVEQVIPLPWPGNLLLYKYEEKEMEDVDLPEPTRWKPNGLLSHHECDTVSLLPIMALDLKQFDRVLDMDGQQSYGLLILQTLVEVTLDICFTSYRSAFHEASTLLRNYIPEDELDSVEGIQFDKKCFNAYDKVLYVTNSLHDRYSLTEDSSNNIFANKNILKRMAMPAEETEQVFNGIKCLKVGGSMVYATKTISPIHNDGVIMLALRNIQAETNIKMQVVNLDSTVNLLSFFHFPRKQGLRYGNIVIPGRHSRDGPMYVCLLKRVK